VELPGPIVSPQWLEQHLGEPDLVVVDVRWVPNGTAATSFENGHIPGAVSLDLDLDLAAPAFSGGPGRHPLPTETSFVLTMSIAGISDDDVVVVYDDAGGSVAARLWWMLDATGHSAAVMDGGFGAWSGPVERGLASKREPTTFTARPWPRERLADADDVAHARGPIIDARAAERYRGEIEPFDPVAGHIPGAFSAPWTGNLDQGTGRFRTPEELRRRFAHLGVRHDVDTIAYCGSGTTACHNVLAMRAAGFTNVRLYEGSWSDWVHDPKRRIAIGDVP
jgi:thiosulfate/3-mercaptopyruvate sulfurtransferase